jgi:hypothetical protein
MIEMASTTGFTKVIYELLADLILRFETWAAGTTTLAQNPVKPAGKA